jgi:homoserine O-acetyltransferase
LIREFTHLIQHANKARLPVALPLEGGGLLVDAEIAWESYGYTDPEHAIVLLHDFPDSHRALGTGFGEGWGKQLLESIGPYSGWVVSLNLLGSPFGSTSESMMPLSKDGKPQLSLSLEDLARAATSAMKTLGIVRARAVVGIGLGGMVAIKAAALFPEITQGVITFGSALTLPGSLRDALGMASHLVRAGSYRKALTDFMIWTHRREHLLHWHDGAEGLERWLFAQADDFCARFDGRAWAGLATAYAGADLKGELEKYRCKTLLVAGSHDELAPPTRVRDAYHAIEAAGGQARFYELSEERGHAFLLTDIARMKAQLGEFFSSLG